MRSCRTVVLVFLLLVIPSCSGTVIVNSEDWRDTFTALSYAEAAGEESILVDTPGQAELAAETLGNGEHLLLVSRESPAVADLTRRLKLKGLDVKRTEFSWEDQYSLYSEVENKSGGLIVVDGEFGQSAITVFPKVVREDYFLIFNDSRTAEFVDKSSANIIFAGMPTMEGGDLHIKEEDPGAVNREFISRGLGDFRQVVLTGRNRIERQALTSGKPLLLKDSPRELASFLRDSKVDVIEVMGASNLAVARQVDALMERDIGIVVKVARKVTGSFSGDYPLQYLEVRQRNPGVEMGSVLYDRESGELSVPFRNTGNVQSPVRIRQAMLDTGQGEIRLPGRVIRLDPGDQLAMVYRIPEKKNVSSASFKAYSDGKRLTGGNGLEPQPVYSGEIVPPTTLELESLGGEEKVAALRNTGSQGVWVKLFPAYNASRDVKDAGPVWVGPGEKKSVSLPWSASAGNITAVYGQERGRYSYSIKLGEERAGTGIGAGISAAILISVALTLFYFTDTIQRFKDRLPLEV